MNDISTSHRTDDRNLPQPVAEPPPIIEPRDVDYPGVLGLVVDASDVARGIFRIRETIPLARAGRITLLYPKWVPGFHAPAAEIELFAGLEVRACQQVLPWRRDPIEMHAFHVEPPEDCPSLEVTFQFLSPTTDQQGQRVVTPAMLAVRWSAMLLYPAGYFSRRIRVRPRLIIPSGWAPASPLVREGQDAAALDFATVSLDELVDGPVLAGRFTRCVSLDAAQAVTLNLAADRPEQLAATDEQIAAHRAVVAEADALFGARPFSRYDYLVALSDEMGGGGVEHRRACEIVVPADYFTAWEANVTRRDVFAHEYLHAWNGKFRRGVDSWTPSFERPIRNSLMWVYEGLTQYWGEVLAVRAGLWTAQQAREALALTAALYSNRPGGAWRPLSDTTRDPIIAERAPLPWPSWQRSEDYYAEGQLLWLDIDTLIRELSGDRRSLDDFASRFFGGGDPQAPTSTYDFDDVVAGLAEVAAHDWKGFLTRRLESREVGAPLDGLARGGYRLVYRSAPSDFAMAKDAAGGVLSLRFSIGLVVAGDGTIQEVVWDSPAFEAGLTAGATILAIGGRAYAADLLTKAIDEAAADQPIDLLVRRGPHHQSHLIRWSGGGRHPHLQPVEGARRRLDEILAPRAG